MPSLRPAALMPLALPLILGACAKPNAPAEPQIRNALAPVITVKVIAFNDLHGHLQPPGQAVMAPTANGPLAVPAGGMAYLATAIQHLKAKNPLHAVVSAGDMIGATPLASALFLDEPTIEAVNAMQIDFNAVGNHEFDKGQHELMRMQSGGCLKHTALEPCQLSKPFAGANFGFLAANVQTPDGGTLFPATGSKTFVQGGQRIKVAFIGMTLKGTPRMVTPAGVAGLRFHDEAQTANALAPRLRAEGADAVVLVVHEGGMTPGSLDDSSCAGLTGDIVPILEQLDTTIDVVVSGHTHRAYTCDYGRINPAKPFLLTSAGQHGTLLTDIDLVFDTATRKLVSKSASNLVVQGEAFTNGAGKLVATTPLLPRFERHAVVHGIVERYAAAAAPQSARVVGRLAASITRDPSPSLESPLGNLIADAQLAATRAPDRGSAQIAFMNPGGVRADLLVPVGGGPVTFGQIFSVQPFGNSLVVKTFTGQQIRALLEQQFNQPGRPRLMHPSEGFTYHYALARPAGSRVSEVRLNGDLLQDSAAYRVTMNSFMATGGDGFSVFAEGTETVGGALDVDAMLDYLRVHPVVQPPATVRVRRL